MNCAGKKGAGKGDSCNVAHCTVYTVKKKLGKLNKKKLIEKKKNDYFKFKLQLNFFNTPWHFKTGSASLVFLVMAAIVVHLSSRAQ